MRNFVEQDHPAVLRRPLPRPPAGDVHDLVVIEAARAGDLQRAGTGLDREDAALGAGRILETAQGEEENRAERDPRGVEPAKHGDIIRIVTRSEIAETLIAIVKKEKDVPDELLQPETPLADAGIDSLDALTILFAIEEQFAISIPDDKARAMRTFGDMIDIVEELVPVRD
jgi:acyl carrier protein